VNLASQGVLWSRAEKLLADPNLMRTYSEVAKGYQYPDRLSEELLINYLEPIMGTEEKTKVFERMLLSLKKEDLMALEPALKCLEVPVLLVWGTRDVFFSLEWAHWLQKTLPDIQGLVEIEDGALFFVDERAAEFVPHLDQFWSGLA
jgi:pimeloyl-ACP methyl ester carboxylesterase